MWVAVTVTVARCPAVVVMGFDTIVVVPEALIRLGSVRGLLGDCWFEAPEVAYLPRTIAAPESVVNGVCTQGSVATS